MKANKIFGGRAALAPRAILLALVVGCVGALAQTGTSSVRGTVVDQQGNIVPGAAVTLTDLATRSERAGTTNDEGFYLFTNVTAGEYALTVEREGFKKTQVENVKVDVSIPATVSVELAAGEITEVVTTTSSEAQAVINTENAELATVVSARQIQDLPLNTRNPVQLATLQAGVVSNTGSTRSATINGMRGSYNNITWDGINVQENYLRGSGNSSLFAQAGPRASGVGEFTIITQNSSAADGTGAAQVKLVTPRGGSEYHG
ncbi:MAG: carboxypeptidase regulatory-like domain-containing protein, partial [Pyrinomonadaceae bacterium]